MYSYEFKQKHLLCTCKLDLVGTLLFHLSNHYRMNMLYILSQLFIKLRYMQGCTSTSSPALKVFKCNFSVARLPWQLEWTRCVVFAVECLHTCAHTQKHTKSVRCNWFNCLWAEGWLFHVKLVADWRTKAVYSERTRVQLFHKGTVLLYASNCGTEWLGGDLKPGGWQRLGCCGRKA